MEDFRLRAALENLRIKSCTSEDIAYLDSIVSMPSGLTKNIKLEGHQDTKTIVSRNVLKDMINTLGSLRFGKETDQPLTRFYCEDQILQPQHLAALGGVVWDMNKTLQKILWSQYPSSNDRNIAPVLDLCVEMPVIIWYNSATELCITRGQNAFVWNWVSSLGLWNQRMLDVVFVMLDKPLCEIKIPGLLVNIVLLVPRSESIGITLPNGGTLWVTRTQVHMLPGFSISDYSSQGFCIEKNVVNPLFAQSHQSMYTALS